MRPLTWYERWWDWLLIKLFLRKPAPITWVASVGWKYSSTVIDDIAIQLEKDQPTVVSKNNPQ